MEYPHLEQLFIEDERPIAREEAASISTTESNEAEILSELEGERDGETITDGGLDLLCVCKQIYDEVYDISYDNVNVENLSGLCVDGFAEPEDANFNVTIVLLDSAHTAVVHRYIVVAGIQQERIDVTPGFVGQVKDGHRLRSELWRRLV